MKRCLLAGVVALSWLAVAVGPRAEAQFAGPPQVNPFGRPAVSPYLNLQRGGINPGVNYYGLVRPQIDTSRSLQQLQHQFSMGTGAGAATGGLGMAVDDSNRVLAV